MNSVSFNIADKTGKKCVPVILSYEMINYIISQGEKHFMRGKWFSFGGIKGI